MLVLCLAHGRLPVHVYCREKKGRGFWFVFFSRFFNTGVSEEGLILIKHLLLELMAGFLSTSSVPSKS